MKNNKRFRTVIVWLATLGAVCCGMIPAMGATIINVGGDNSGVYPATWRGLYDALTDATAASAADDVLVRLSSFDGSGGAAAYLRTADDLANGLFLSVSNLTSAVNDYRVTIRGGYTQDFSTRSGSTKVDGNINHTYNPTGALTYNTSDNNARLLLLTAATGGQINVRNLALTGGGVTSTSGTGVSGSGIFSATRVRLDDLVVQNCSVQATAAHGAIYLGGAADRSVIQNVTVQNTKHLRFAGAVLVDAGAENILVANSTFRTNFVVGGSQHNQDAPAVRNKGQATLFGILAYDGDVSSNIGGVVTTADGGQTYLAHATIADNQDAACRQTHNASFSSIRNCIFADNGTVAEGLAQIHTGAWGYSQIVQLNDGATYTIAPNPAVGVAGDPNFANAPGRDYRLTVASLLAIDQGGFLRTMTQAEKDTAFGTGVTQAIRYVDVDDNNAYNAQRDVIVALGGYQEPLDDNPTDYDLDNAILRNHFVVVKDLAGNPRVSGSAIDLGAYEFLSSKKGTLILIR